MSLLLDIYSTNIFFHSVSLSIFPKVFTFNVIQFISFPVHYLRNPYLCQDHKDILSWFYVKALLFSFTVGSMEVSEMDFCV